MKGKHGEQQGKTRVVRISEQTYQDLWTLKKSWGQTFDKAVEQLMHLNAAQTVYFAGGTLFDDPKEARGQAVQLAAYEDKPSEPPLVLKVVGWDDWGMSE